MDLSLCIYFTIKFNSHNVLVSTVLYLFYNPPPNQQNKCSSSKGTSIQEYEWNSSRPQSRQGLGEYWSTEETAACVIENIHNKVLES